MKNRTVLLLLFGYRTTKEQFRILLLQSKWNIFALSVSSTGRDVLSVKSVKSPQTISSSSSLFHPHHKVCDGTTEYPESEVYTKMSSIGKRLSTSTTFFFFFFCHDELLNQIKIRFAQLGAVCCLRAFRRSGERLPPSPQRGFAALSDSSGYTVKKMSGHQFSNSCLQVQTHFFYFSFFFKVKSIRIYSTYTYKYVCPYEWSYVCVYMRIFSIFFRKELSVRTIITVILPCILIYKCHICNWKAMQPHSPWWCFFFFSFGFWFLIKMTMKIDSQSVLKSTWLKIYPCNKHRPSPHEIHMCALMFLQFQCHPSPPPHPVLTCRSLCGLSPVCPCGAPPAFGNRRRNV